MKKIVKFLVLIFLFTFFVVGCDNKETVDSNSPITGIDYSTFNKMLKEEKTFILEVVQTGCSNCTSFTPTFENVLEKYNLTAYSINITNMTDADRNTFLDEYKIDGTPAVLFFKNGSETSTLKRIVGNQNSEKIISKLKANGYIEN